MKFGICCAPGALGEPARLIEILSNAGADYVEWAVGALMASEGEFERLRALAHQSNLKPEAFCAFLPPTQRITGPNVDLNSVLNYATTACERVSAVGGEIIVLGSGGARKVPNGFSPEEARRQFIQFGRELGPRAAQHEVVIVVEPLNTSEDNLITSVEIGAEIVQEIAHPNIQLLADFYHMNEEDESVASIVAAGGKIRHTHTADLNRVAPGYAKGEADFVAFFGALKTIGYNARCSFEGKTDDLARQAAPLLQTLRDRYNSA